MTKHQELIQSVRDVVGETTGRWITPDQAEHIANVILGKKDELLRQLRSDAKPAHLQDVLIKKTQQPRNDSRVSPEYVSVEEAERMTGRSRWTWRKDAYAGKISSTKIGRRLLLPIAEVRSTMEEGKRPRVKGAR